MARFARAASANRATDTTVLRDLARFAQSGMVKVVPQRVALGKQTPASGGGAGGRARGAISSVLPTGSDWYYRVSCGGGELIVRQNDAPDLRLGDPVWIAAEPAPLKVFGADGRALTDVAGLPARPAPTPPTTTAAVHTGRT